ncbi:MAG TPA: L-threonylcarbamoyladenylate synthase [Longimicrobiales bacterium]|nr:L-threonylcarbamoyladenylate synthase [Longimicrobiales bacterium]
MTPLPFCDQPDFDRAIPQAAAHLRAGGILGYPTETVYGLGCVLEPAALERLAQLKGGRTEKSFLLVLGTPDQAEGLIWTPAARKLAAAFWPGPLTLALPARSGRYPDRVVSAAGTVAIRVTAHSGVRQLLIYLGEPVSSTSANLPGREPASTAAEVAELLTGATDADTLILDAGRLPPAAPSTVVDCSETVPRIVRQGAIPYEALKDFLE